VFVSVKGEERKRKKKGGRERTN